MLMPYTPTVTLLEYRYSITDTAYTYRCSYHSLYAHIIAERLKEKEFYWLVKQITEIIEQEARLIPSDFATDEGEIGEVLMRIKTRLKDKVRVKGGILCK